MKRTRLAVLLLTLGWLAFPLALLAGTLAPAFLGVLLVAYVLGARSPAPVLRIERQAPERAVAGQPFEVVTTAEDAEGHPLFLDEDIPLGARVLSRDLQAARGRATLRLTLVADDPGALRWGGARVRYQDAGGLLEGEVRLGLPSFTEVAPDKDAVLAGRRAADDLERSTRARARRGMDLDPEIERLRDYVAGDRMRDIDWAHTAKLGRLITRDLRRESTMPIVILLHAGRSMRRRRRAGKLASATRAALGLLGAAEASGVAAGLVAWSERGVEAQVRAATGRRAVNDALARLATLPETLEYEAPRHHGGAGPARALLPAEQAFLQRASAFAPVAASTPTTAALAALQRVTSQPSLVLAFLDLEESPQLAQAILSRLRHHGHRAVLVAPASGAHHYGRGEVDQAALAQLHQWWLAREEARLVARRYQTPLVTLWPDAGPEALREVVASVQ